MAWNTSGPAQLGADNVIRFLDADHFLRELQGNLGRGRAFVRSKRKFDLKSSLALRIEAPGVSWGVNVEAVVVFVKDGFVGLEFEDFENGVLPKLDLLGEEAAKAVDPGASQAERTVIAPTPMQFRQYTDEGSGSAQVSADLAEEEERTGEMYISPELQSDLRQGREPFELPSEGSDAEAQMIGVADLRRELSGDLVEELERAEQRERARDPKASKKKSEAKVVRGVSRGGSAAIVREEPEAREEPEPDSDLAEEVFSEEDYTQDGGDHLEGDDEQMSTHADLRYEDPLIGSRRMPKARTTTAVESEVTSDAIDARPPLRAKRSPSGSRLDHIEQATMRLKAKSEPPPDDDPASKTQDRPSSDFDEGGVQAPDRADTPLASEEEQELRASPPSRPSRGSAVQSPPSKTSGAQSAPVAVPPPPPAGAVVPAIVVAGADALADKSLHIARATSSGVLRAADAGTLLGLYLAEMRHGHLTVLGGPEGKPGEQVKLRLAAGFVITLECTVVARVGEWLTVRIQDATPIRDALRDIADAWREALLEITGPEGEPVKVTSEAAVEAGSESTDDVPSDEELVVPALITDDHDEELDGELVGEGGEDGEGEELDQLDEGDQDRDEEEEDREDREDREDDRRVPRRDAEDDRRLAERRVAKRDEDDRRSAKREEDNRRAAKRDEDRPAKRDEDDRRSAKRDEDRPAKRDEDRPAKRDEDRPAKRDEDRPAKRDEDDRRAAKRDEDRPARRDEDDRRSAKRDEDDRRPAKRDDDRRPAQHDDDDDDIAASGGPTASIPIVPPPAPSPAPPPPPPAPTPNAPIAASTSASQSSSISKSGPLLDIDAMMEVALPRGHAKADPEPPSEELMGPELPAPRGSRRREPPPPAADVGNGAKPASPPSSPSKSTTSLPKPSIPATTTGTQPKPLSPSVSATLPKPSSATGDFAAPSISQPIAAQSATTAPTPSPPKPTIPPPAATTIPDDAPPQLPKLNGDLVSFQRVKDLRHEIETNLKNGGLFVESAALPLRTHKSLKVAIGGVLTAVKIEADVVFAAGGRVGFSVGGVQDVKTALEKAIETHLAGPPIAALPTPAAAAPASAAAPTATPSPPAAPPPGSPSATYDLTPQMLSQAQEKAAAPDGLSPFSGRISKPFSHSELIDFQTKRAKTVNDLVAAPMLSTFEYICRHNGRGVLSVKSGDHRGVIYFHEGQIAFVETAPFEEESSLGRMLVMAKKLSEGAVREGLDRAKQQKRPLGRVLVSLGSITKKVLSETLREQSRVKIDAMFSWKEGTTEWSSWREPPGDADLVLTKGAGIMARYVAKRYETLGVGELEAMFGKNMGRIVVLNDDADTIGTTIGLQQKELRFLEVSMVGERTISDAVMGSPLGRLGSLRLVATGLAMGMMHFRDGRLGTNVGPVRSKSETDSPQIAALKRDLKERINLLKGLNHFEVLGVHWSAHYRAYRAPYEKMKRELDITRGTLRDAPPEVQELAREIVRTIEKAYGTLSDEKGRVSYRNQFFDKTERQYSADMLVKQGEVALMRGDRVGAIEALETAVELDPSARNRSLLANAREGKT